MPSESTNTVPRPDTSPVAIVVSPETPPAELVVAPAPSFSLLLGSALLLLELLDPPPQPAITTAPITANSAPKKIALVLMLASF
jgi:hypothetical protein